MICWVIVFVFDGQVGVQKEYASGEEDDTLASDATYQENFAWSSVILPCVSTTFSSFHVLFHVFIIYLFIFFYNGYSVFWMNLMGI
jgi:hypothetical protein